MLDAYLKPSEVSNVDLKDFEVAILTTIFSFYTSIVGGVESQTLENKLEKIGYDGLGLALGITTLQDRGFISSSVELIEEYNNSYDAKIYRISESGIEWIKLNQNALEIKAKPNLKQPKQSVPDDDIPF